MDDIIIEGITVEDLKLLEELLIITALPIGDARHSAAATLYNKVVTINNQLNESVTT